MAIVSSLHQKLIGSTPQFRLVVISDQSYNHPKVVTKIGTKVSFTPLELVACVLALGSAAAGTPILFRSSQRMAKGRRLLSARFGGLCLVPAILLGWLYISMQPSTFIAWYFVVISATALLLLVAWMSGLHRLPAYPGMVVKIGVICGAMLAVPDSANLLSGLGMLPERVVLTGAWIAFLFAHGRSVKIPRASWMLSMPLSISIAILGLNVGERISSHAAIVSLALLGFGLWHLWGAKVALGHTGTWPLGFMLGGLLVLLATQGLGLEALILALPSVVLALWPVRPSFRAYLILQTIAGLAAFACMTYQSANTAIFL